MIFPLSGVRVLDLSRVLAGPIATMILGDLGADVIKIERPGGGDETRGWGPPFDDRRESAYFLSCNRNKLSVAADLESDTDRVLIRSLIAGADLVVDNFKSGTLERRGLDPNALLTEHSSPIWCTMTGFGADSPRPGYDYVVQAEAGWMSITGEPDGSPMKTGVALADVMAGRDIAIALLAALAGRHRGTAIQRRLHVSLYHTAVSALANVAQNALVSGKEAGRWGNAHANLVPYELFPAVDRPIVIAVGSDAQFAALATALELPALGEARFRTNSGRIEHRAELVAMIRARLVTAEAVHWTARLDAAGVPNGVVRTVLEALADVQSSPLTGVAPIAPASVRRPPPTLDQHGDAVRARGWNAVRD